MNLVRSVLRTTSTAALAFVFFLVTIGFGTPVADQSLDVSWLMVLAWGFANSAQIGTDLVFTYGPWAIVHPQFGWHETAYDSFLLFMPLFAALTTLVAFGSLWRARRLVLALTAAIVVALGTRLAGDGAWLLALCLGLTGIAGLIRSDAGLSRAPGLSGRNHRLDGFYAVLLALFAAWIGLVKFSLLPAGLLVVAAAALSLSMAGRRTIALAITATYAAAVPLLWISAGQDLSGLPLYLSRGLAIAAGYGATMGTRIHPLVDLTGLAVLTLTGVLLLWRLYDERRTPARLVLTLALAGVVALGWRAGFTRSDAGHVIFFVTVAAAAVVHLAERPGWCSRIAIGALLPMAMFLHFSVVQQNPFDAVAASLKQAGHNLDHLGNPELPRLQHVSYADFRRRQLRTELSGISTRIGNGSADVLGVEQGVAINLGLDYRPRPVFQSYSAYGDELARLNEAHFVNANTAPEFALVKLNPIDGRLGSSEDPLALAAIVRAYQPMEYESGFLLMQRHAGDITPTPRPADWRDVGFGDWIDVPELATTATLAHLRVTPSFAGRLHGLLLREPPLYIELDKGINTVQRYRVPRPALSAGFIVDPIIHRTADLIDLYALGSSERAERFRVVSEDASANRWFSGRVSVAFTAISAPSMPRSDELLAMAARQYPGFSHLPDRIQSYHTTQKAMEEATVLLVHAPARIEFQLPAGTFLLELRVGILPEAVDEPACQDADGVTFTVSAGPQVLAALRVPIGAEEEILTPSWNMATPHALRVEVDAHDDLRCDWSYVRTLRISQMQEQADGSLRSGAVDRLSR